MISKVGPPYSLKMSLTLNSCNTHHRASAIHLIPRFIVLVQKGGSAIILASHRK
jgi:hypothetical protein